MRNLKFLLCIVILLCTISCTDNTENLITDPPPTSAKSIGNGIEFTEGIQDPKNGSGDSYTGNDGNNGNDGGKGN